MLAGTVVAGAAFVRADVGAVVARDVLLYTAGMFLNDAFDATSMHGSVPIARFQRET